VLVVENPSLTVRVMVVRPALSGWGVTFTVRLLLVPLAGLTTISESCTSVGLDETAVTVRLSPSASVSVNGSAAVGVLVGINWLAMLVAKPGAPTRTRKEVSLVWLAGSVTTTVIVASPCCPAAGVMVIVRFWPLPPKLMFAGWLGTTAGLSEVPSSVRLAGL